MTRRSGLNLALVGLGMVGLWFAICVLLALFEDRIPPGLNDSLIAYVIAIGGGLLVGLMAILGLIFIVVGLVFALRKQSAKPS